MITAKTREKGVAQACCTGEPNRVENEVKTPGLPQVSPNGGSGGFK